MSSFCILPNELLIEIFSFSSKKVLYSLCQCSREFYNIVHSQPMYRQYCIRFLSNSVQYLFNKKNLVLLYKDTNCWKKTYDKLLKFDVDFFGFCFLTGDYKSIKRYVQIENSTVSEKYRLKQAIESNMDRYLLDLKEREINYSFDEYIDEDNSIMIHFEDIPDDENLKGCTITKGDYYKKAINCDPFNSCLLIKIYEKFKKQFRFINTTSIEAEIPKFEEECNELLKKTLKKDSKSGDLDRIRMLLNNDNVFLFGNL